MTSSLCKKIMLIWFPIVCITSAAALFFIILLFLQVYLILLFFSVAAVSILYFCIILGTKMLLFRDTCILSSNCENDLCVALTSKGAQSCISFCQPWLQQVVTVVMSLCSTCTLHSTLSANTTLAPYAFYLERVLAGIKFSHSG